MYTQINIYIYAILIYKKVQVISIIYIKFYPNLFIILTFIYLIFFFHDSMNSILWDNIYLFVILSQCQENKFNSLLFVNYKEI